jgi:Holliday junction resolvase RusA-like endonuclease
MGLTFEVPGEPRGKGRPRFTKTGHTYTDSETKAYEQKIVAYYHKTFGAFRWADGSFIRIKVTAHYPIPKSATKAAIASMQAGGILPSRKPDIDNVLKIVLDALNGVAYKDDSRVVSVEAEKIYSFTPKLVIEIQGSEP